MGGEKDAGIKKARKLEAPGRFLSPIIIT